MLAATRGYSEAASSLSTSPPSRWEWIELTAPELAQVRYIDYSYWKSSPVAAAWRLILLRASRRVRPWASRTAPSHCRPSAARQQQFPPRILPPHRESLVCWREPPPDRSCSCRLPDQTGAWSASTGTEQSAQ